MARAILLMGNLPRCGFSKSKRSKLDDLDTSSMFESLLNSSGQNTPVRIQNDSKNQSQSNDEDVEAQKIAVKLV
jgi:hypothetical protein